MSSGMLFSCFNRVHNAHSGNGVQRDSRGSEARGHRDGSSLQNGCNGDCHHLQGVCLRRADEDAADIAQHRTDHRRENAVICALPQEGFVQTGGAHADGALHPDLADAGVDIAINGVDDIQNTDHTDQRDQHPAEHFDLGEALRHFLTALAIGKPLCTGIFSAPAVQPCFKGGGVCILFQRGADLRIVVAARQRTIQRVADKNLHTVGSCAATRKQIWRVSCGCAP